jgi:hypothetical protein
VSDEQPRVPDVERLARSMLLIHGGHDDEHGRPADGRSSHRKPAPANPRTAADLGDATRHDRDRYLNSGLQPVDCRFCHVSVLVK